jgi:D-alanyl-D-alanine carboxypeptidase/D-alanyl-D-alanine-endopeptidase (penicillin-binding protein 4)
MRRKFLLSPGRSIRLPGLSLLFFFLFLGAAESQTVSEKLQSAVEKMEADSQMRHAILGLYVINAATGAIVFEENSGIGLAPASCQKLFTSVAVLDLLGPEYRYRTSLGYDGKPVNGALTGHLYILGSGDPTLGSWRFDSAKAEAILRRWVRAIGAAGIRKFEGDIIVDDGHWDTQPIPRGWISEDIGNYYGAGAWGLDWHENQFDLRLKPGKTPGDSVTLVKPPEELETIAWINECRTGAAGSGDNAFIYTEPYSPLAFVRGTIPLQKADFVIAGSIPVPPRYAGILLGERLKKEGIVLHAGDVHMSLELKIDQKVMGKPSVILDTYFSPRLDSINYWFLKKSINLYGEALIKTLAFERTGAGSTEKGAELVRDFWSERGIDPGSMHIQDGSGLSPQNRVTTDALVKVLQYARSRPWFNVFYQALPEINGMRMKSGAISGARCYAGYQKSGDGNEYIFSVIVNNYDGSPTMMTHQLFGILDNLK